MKLVHIAATIALLSVSSVTFAQTKAKHAAAAPAADGKAIYGRVCITCHMADGMGVPNMNPPIVKTPYILGNKTKVINIVLNGFNESVEIEGNQYSNVMPSQDFLKDNEIAAVLTYVRSHFGNKASAITTTDVKKARAAKKKK